MHTISTRTVLILPVIVAMTACVPSPQDLESEPVKISTPKGTVTCQLYTESRVLWDRAIDFPAAQMSVPEADGYCREEGLRRLNR